MAILVKFLLALGVGVVVILLCIGLLAAAMLLGRDLIDTKKEDQ